MSMNWKGLLGVAMLGQRAVKPTLENYARLTNTGTDAGILVEDNKIMVSYLAEGKGACDLRYRNNFMSQMALISPQGKMPLVVDCRNLTWIDEEVFQVIRDMKYDVDEPIGMLPAVAWVCSNSIQRAIAEVFRKVVPLPVPMKIFRDIGTAKEWAKTFYSVKFKEDHGWFVLHRIEEAPAKCPTYVSRAAEEVTLSKSMCMELLSSFRGAAIESGQRINVILTTKNIKIGLDTLHFDWRSVDWTYIHKLVFLYENPAQHAIAMISMALTSHAVKCDLAASEAEAISSMLDSEAEELGDFSFIPPGKIVTKPGDLV